MTSNLGAKQIAGQSKVIGFGEDSDKISDEKIKSAVMGELKKAFRPEFLGRIDEVIVFSQLTSAETEEIAGRMIDTLRDRLMAMDMQVDFTDEVKKLVAKAGFDPIYGARPLRRAIQSQIEDLLAEKMLEENIKKGDSIKITTDGDKLTVEK